jgi:hypothetical protein
MLKKIQRYWGDVDMSQIAFLEEGALTQKDRILVVPPTKEEWEEFRLNLVLPEYITHVGVLFELGKEEALQHTWKVSLSLSDWRLIAQVGQKLELYERFRGSIYVKVVDYCQDIISENLENNEEPIVCAWCAFLPKKWLHIKNPVKNFYLFPW